MDRDMRLRKVCPQCNTVVHVKRSCCGCGHVFIININPRRACAARVTVLGLSFCLSFCLSVRTRYSGSTHDKSIIPSC